MIKYLQALKYITLSCVVAYAFSPDSMAQTTQPAHNDGTRNTAAVELLTGAQFPMNPPGDGFVAGSGFGKDFWVKVRTDVVGGDVDCNKEKNRGVVSGRVKYTGTMNLHEICVDTYQVKMTIKPRSGSSNPYTLGDAVELLEREHKLRGGCPGVVTNGSTRVNSDLHKYTLQAPKATIEYYFNGKTRKSITWDRHWHENCQRVEDKKGSTTGGGNKIGGKTGGGTGAHAIGGTTDGGSSGSQNINGALAPGEAVAPSAENPVVAPVITVPGDATGAPVNAEGAGH